jgi:hypothetical protein
MKIGMETLESNVIRHLILKAKLTGDDPSSNFQIASIVQTVVNMAVEKHLLTEMPRLDYSNPLADKITAVIWELIIEGVYTPGQECSSQICHSSEPLSMDGSVSRPGN